jgi:hypothetical protein
MPSGGSQSWKPDVSCGYRLHMGKKSARRRDQRKRAQLRLKDAASAAEAKAAAAEPAATPPGGQGDSMSRSDMRTVAQAFDERWPMPPVVRDSFAKEAARMFFDRNRPDRTRIAAGKLMVSADRVNLQQEALRIMDLEQRLKAIEKLNHDVGPGNA